MQNQATVGGHSVIDRIMGVVTLKAPIYREIADDTTATSQAAIIVVVMAIIGGILAAVVVGIAGNSLSGSLPQGVAAPTPSAFGTLISTIINTIIGWLVGSWVFAFVSTTFFGGKTNMWEMARVFGFTQVFQILNIVPCIGWLAALVLSVIGAIIGIREASEFDTNKAILTGVIGFIGVVVVTFIIGLILSPLGL